MCATCVIYPHYAFDFAAPPPPLTKKKRDKKHRKGSDKGVRASHESLFIVPPISGRTPSAESCAPRRSRRCGTPPPGMDPLCVPPPLHCPRKCQQQYGRKFTCASAKGHPYHDHVGDRTR